MRIDGSGNVGIGVDVPTNDLDILGQIRMRGTSGTAGYIPVSDANGVMTWTDPLTINTAQDHDWYKATTTDQADAISNDIYTNGFVGVGTSTPQKKLDVSDTRADILLKTTRGEALSNEVLSSLLFYNSDQSTSGTGEELVLQSGDSSRCIWKIKIRIWLWNL